MQDWQRVVVIVGVIIVLLVWEYVDQDCIVPGRCVREVAVPESHMNAEERILRLYEMIGNSYSYASWRQALLVGLIVVLPVVVILEGRVPSLGEWIVLALVVAIIVFFSHSWIWTHFFYPNGQQIERGLLQLRSNLKVEGKKKSKSEEDEE